jgi:hypothetical protein
MEGESLTINIKSEQDAYAYVLYEQADGTTYQVFPNSTQKNNRISAETVVSIPAADDQFRWIVRAPFGKETVKVIAAKRPLSNLEDPDVRVRRFSPINRVQLANVSKSLKDTNPIEWAECEVQITTYPPGDERPVPGSKRFGVFFGVSRHEFNDAAKEAAAAVGKQWEPDLPTPANDASAMANLMLSLGQLNDARLFVDEDATRRNMEHAITEWLPTVSRPNDIVFIFFSGHGGQVNDDNRDEPDQKDEWLLPHDYVDASILEVLLKHRNEGRLDPRLASRVAQLANVAQREGSFQRAVDLLCRATGVTDDLFGHWLQRLSGRKVIVLLDSCHAGGLANHEKGFAYSQAMPMFDFLEGEVGRLKDIGQSDSALLAACGAQQTAAAVRISDAMLDQLRAAEKGAVDQWNPDTAFSVMAYYLVESMITAPRPMTLDDAYQHCRERMREYFGTYNALRRHRGEELATPHEPVLIKYTSQPLIMKP